MKKVFETWLIDEATDIMKAAERLELEYEFEQIKKT